MSVSTAHAETVNPQGGVTTTITGTGTYDDGSIYIFFASAISGCSTEDRLDIAANHPAKDQILAIAMTAFTSGKSVRIRPGGCIGSTPNFGTVGDSFFYLIEP